MINWESILKKADIFINAIDIGCSGIRPHQWVKFGSQIKYFGIDPLESEIEKLKKELPETPEEKLGKLTKKHKIDQKSAEME